MTRHIAQRNEESYFNLRFSLVEDYRTFVRTSKHNDIAYSGYFKVLERAEILKVTPQQQQDAIREISKPDPNEKFRDRMRRHRFKPKISERVIAMRSQIFLVKKHFAQMRADGISPEDLAEKLDIH